MGLKINNLDQPLERDAGNYLTLPTISLETTTDNQAQLASYDIEVNASSPELRDCIRGAYTLNADTGGRLRKLLIPYPIRPRPVQFAGDLRGASCSLRVRAQFYDSNEEGKPVLYRAGAQGADAEDARRAVEHTVRLLGEGAALVDKPGQAETQEKVYAIPIVPESSKPKPEPERTPEPEPEAQPRPNGPRFAGLVAIDFGTSNSTVAVYDPRLVPVIQGLPREQEERLRALVLDWVQQNPEDALPGLAQEWEEFLRQVARILGLGGRPDVARRLQEGSSADLHEVLRQMELFSILRPESFRRAAHVRLHQIFHEALRVPLMRSQNLFSAKIDLAKKEDSIPSESEVCRLQPQLQLEMGIEARRHRLDAFDSSKSDGAAGLAGRFHPAPKRYFGTEEQTFQVTLDGRSGSYSSTQLIQAAWSRLIELAQLALDSERQGPAGRIDRVIITYPTASPPQMRRQIEQLRDELKLVEEVVTDYDEAISAAIFFLLREFGGTLDVGLEAFRVRCKADGPRASQNVLVLDVGGGTTDLALIRLTLDEIDPFQPGEDRGAGGRYYVITPRLLGSSGNLQLGGDLATLRVFHLLKTTVADHLLGLVQEGHLNSQGLKDCLTKLGEPFIGGDGRYRPGSLLQPIDRDCPETDADYLDGCKAVQKVLPTNWASRSQLLQVFYTLWELAEDAKKALGTRPLPGTMPRTAYEVAPDKVAEVLRQAELIDAAAPNLPLERLGVSLTAEQFQRAVALIVREVALIARGLLASRLSETETVDWLILSGQTCNLELLHRELRQVFSASKNFVWNPERVTFVPEYAKRSTAVGACLAEKFRWLRSSPEGAKDQLREGVNQLYFEIRNLFFFLPCDFQLTGGAAPIFPAGTELHQLDASPVGKARSKPRFPSEVLIVERKDFEGKTTLWGTYSCRRLADQLGVSRDDFLRDFRAQFEIDHRLNIALFLWQGERPHYLVDDAPERLELPPTATATPAANQATAPSPAPSVLEWDLAVNVLQAVPAPGRETVLFRKGSAWQEVFQRTDGSTRRGLISAPLPPFPHSRRHGLYARRDGDWQLLGELVQPASRSDYPRLYFVTVDEQGGVQLHAGQVPYSVAEQPAQLVRQPGCVLRQELELQPRTSNEDRDPFCGKH